VAIVIKEVLCAPGRGGMGAVYKARRLVDDRLVALKMILGAGSPRFLEFARFCREAQAVACLSHPNIVKICDAGVYRRLSLDRHPHLSFPLLLSDLSPSRLYSSARDFVRRSHSISPGT
jgi:serine/threonine protein kinase